MEEIVGPPPLANQIRELQSQRLRRTVGDGTTISIFNDAWIPGYGKLHYLRHNSDVYTTVANLLTPTKEWNLTSLQNTFPSDNCQAILTIPLTNIGTPDSYFWSFTPHGTYTVSSGYHQAHTQLHHNDPASSNSTASQDWWKQMWTLPLPPKLKHFLWRTCHDILPTSHNLFKRKILPSSSCCRCLYHDETLEHAPFRCPAVQGIWNCRNKWLHTSLSTAPTQVLLSVVDFLDQYQSCNMKASGSNHAQSVCLLSKEKDPTIPSYHLRLSVDVAKDVQLNKMGFGMAIHTHQGEVLLNLAMPWCGLHSPLLMEAHALYFALLWCHNHSIYPDAIVSDCKI
ncbi:hypothetical protein F8388_005832 [Cannabis sativa]|uniref:Reverse transcriptase zinc-binding domain-containing protein n=1 Tax=Cannabis sativa TaxID=3483 RepID=A0A7J6HHM0_CANSA|nr:hypothetical protein F8388_005832 [Cannabis sativa]